MYEADCYEIESDGYNFPLKGYKGTLYEGGTKVICTLIIDFFKQTRNTILLNEI